MNRKLEKITRMIRKNVSKDISLREYRKSIILEGEVDNWDKVVRAGKLAAKKGYKGVVNKLNVKGLYIPEIKRPSLLDGKLEGKKVDVLIIGGGVIGCSIARELSKYDISILLIEKEEDVSVHASSRNDGMIHPGIASKIGSKMAYYNVKGNEMYEALAKELDVEFKRVGNIILYDNSLMKLMAPYIFLKSKNLGIKGVSHISRGELKNLEPNVVDSAIGGFSFPTTGVISPYKLTVALIENAVMNGAEISLNTIAESFELEGDRIISVITNRGKIYPKIVINAAGVYSDRIAALAGDEFFTIHPRKGEIAIIDKKKGNLINHVLAMPKFNQTSSDTKGGGLIRTIDDNILAGPSAYDQPFREDYSTNGDNINGVLKKHLNVVKGLSSLDVITYFAGIRASNYEEEFIVEKSQYVNNLIHAAGIQSPGLTAAPAIAGDICDIAINELLNFKKVNKKLNFNPIRKGIPNIAKLSLEERSNLIKKRPDYGVILCRCEEISRGEIIDAINSPVPTQSIDGIKRRVRAGMGRCQGGFCMPLITEIISEELNISTLNVTKKGGESNILVGEAKSSFRGFEEKIKDIGTINNTVDTIRDVDLVEEKLREGNLDGEEAAKESVGNDLKDAADKGLIIGNVDGEKLKSAEGGIKIG